MLSEETVVEKPRSVGRPKKDPDAEYKEMPKQFKTRISPNSALYEIYIEDGGQMPKALKGLYTSPIEAQKAADLYKVTRRKFY